MNSNAISSLVNEKKEMKPLITPVVLCGGSGSRLWPVSRKSMPKQFLSFAENRSLFENTLLRFTHAELNQPMVVAAQEYKFFVARQMADLEILGQIILEPEPRNTAPAILAAAFHLAASNPDAIMIALPSDHYLPDHERFAAAVNVGLNAAYEGKLVTFGIEPTRPETGFGYIKIENEKRDGCYSVVAFQEKPEEAKAIEMLETGDYLWNSGMFMATANCIIELAKSHHPELYSSVKDAMAHVTVDGAYVYPKKNFWSLVPSVSIDYAIAEKAQFIACVPYNGTWSDMGDWTSVLKTVEPDKRQNRVHGTASAVECSNSGLISTDPSLQLVGLGLDNIVAVATADAVLVADSSRMQEVNTVVAKLSADHAPQALQHKKTHKPWGWFESLVKIDGYQVKILSVCPGERLSLQSHKYRSEHWIVVVGVATVTLEEKTLEIKKNQSIFIEAGNRHRLANLTDDTLTVIEVQMGSYLEEDDIIRYEDDFGRSFLK